MQVAIIAWASRLFIRALRWSGPYRLLLAILRETQTSAEVEVPLKGQ